MTIDKQEILKLKSLYSEKLQEIANEIENYKVYYQNYNGAISAMNDLLKIIEENEKKVLKNVNSKENERKTLKDTKIDLEENTNKK